MKQMLVLITAIMCSSAFASGTYIPTPLSQLTAKVEQHDKEIESLKKRLDVIEAGGKAAASVPEPESKPNEVTVRVIVERDAAVKVASPAIVSDRVVSSSVTYSSPVVTSVSPVTTYSSSTVSYSPTVQQSVSTVRRLKSTSELSREIRSKWTNQVYGYMARGQENMVWNHLASSEHGYSSSQVNGLSQADAMMLHNLAHNRSLKISPYTSGASFSYSPSVYSQPVVMGADYFNPTPVAPRPPVPSPAPKANYNNCPNGNCARSGASSGWYFGKMLFGRR